MSKRLPISRPAFALLVVLLFTALSGTAVAAGVVPLAKKALFANNAGKLQGKTAAQVAAIPGPATDAQTLGGQTAEQVVAAAGPASTAAALVSYRTAAFTVNADGAQEFGAACASGERAVGGGFNSPSALIPLDSYPSGGGAGWTVYLINPSSSQARSGTVYAVCNK
jgi:hypothetical protein